MKLESNGVRIAAGQTVPGSTDWKQYEKDNKSIMVDVDTSSGGFKNTPLYFTSIGGGEYHWQTIGYRNASWKNITWPISPQAVFFTRCFKEMFHRLPSDFRENSYSKFHSKSFKKPISRRKAPIKIDMR